MDNVSGKLLIAVPGTEDPNFKHSVVLICEHSKEGAFGLIVNRLLMNSIGPLLKAFEIERSLVDLPVYFGGPVRPEQGYVVYEPYNAKYGQTRIEGDLAVTASKDILFDIAGGRGPERFMFALGFSGWTPDQLEEELISDAWLVAPLAHKIIFEVPVTERWRSAAHTIGVDLERFFCRSGCA